MLDFIKSALFCITAFALLSAGYGFSINDKTMLLNSLLLGMPTQTILLILCSLDKGE